MKEERLARSPILVENLGAVLHGYRLHRSSPLLSAALCPPCFEVSFNAVRYTVAPTVKRKGSTVARAATDKERGEIATRPRPRKTRIGIALYPGAKLAAVHGFADLFET